MWICGDLTTVVVTTVCGDHRVLTVLGGGGSTRHCQLGLITTTSTPDGAVATMVVFLGKVKKSVVSTLEGKCYM